MKENNLQFFWDEKEKRINSRYLKKTNIEPNLLNETILDLENKGEIISWIVLDKDKNLFHIVYVDKNPFVSKLTPEERSAENLIKEAENYNHRSPDKHEIALITRIEYIMMYWRTKDIMTIHKEYHAEMVKAFDHVKYAIGVSDTRKLFLEAILFHWDYK